MTPDTSEPTNEELREWRPINAAPKDGTRVLVADRFDTVHIGRWVQFRDGWGGECWEWSYDGKRAEGDPGFCAWMPLPPPPLG